MTRTPGLMRFSENGLRLAWDALYAGEVKETPCNSLQLPTAGGSRTRCIPLEQSSPPVREERWDLLKAQRETKEALELCWEHRQRR